MAQASESAKAIFFIVSRNQESTAGLVSWFNRRREPLLIDTTRDGGGFDLVILLGLKSLAIN